MIYFFDDLRNCFDFFLRSHITLSRKDYSERAGVNIDCNDFPKYNLSLLKDLSERNIKENLYFLNIFDKYLSKKQNADVTLLDIGSKNWNYVKSEYLFTSSLSKNPHLEDMKSPNSIRRI